MSGTGESGPRVGFVTVGCRANSADTQMLEEALRAGGVRVVAEGEEADVYVVNTCTVTHRADADSRAAARRLARAHPGARIVAVGCMAEVAAEALTALPEVDAALGNRDKAALPELVRALVAGEAPGAPTASEALPSPALRAPEAVDALPAERSRPLVKVQDGCDRACSYCIVPRARGRSRSLPVDEVLRTLARYAALGAEELVLSGIHVGLYGRDLTPRTSLAGLLGAIDRDGAVRRVRLSSLEPEEVDDALLEVLARPRFCRHLHLPLQSGHDGTLARMRRPYRTADYAATVARVRAALPDAALGADVIVGFPGEREEDFEDTYAFVERLDLTYLHVFSYSPRPDTPAATFPDPVPPPVAKARAGRLRALSAEKRRAFHARLAGSEAEVLVESRHAADGRLRALSDHYVPVVLDGPDEWMGRIVPVRLEGLEGERVIARALSQEDR